MKLKGIFAFNLVALIATVLCFVTFQAKVTAIALDNRHTVVTMIDNEPRFRVRRQASNKNRGFFSMLSDYISETRDDTIRAFNEISDLVSKLIIPVKQGIQLNYTAPASSRELPENVTTTEAPFVITQQDFLRILRRNLRGLARVFNMESRKAIEASNNNVRILRKEFVDAVRPYVVTNSTT
ncbi:uncharacterized protein LOC111870866 [Cryptotermes secundus]|uniref:uncharacterized protein LOC111870866 n=1 Tax=Cryptotermes secundus TaxID=105785 RepID=UPI000CD7ABA1|nr:uncharacterized protein LOC111870866 [Cryptotermes secundus]XP_023719227.1 uncharacterized protein LOC111870866 [Cryptotermes secundus]XP_023719228.1 uncharacterized protein LOC111870866 [Cryptotermes secundus]